VVFWYKKKGILNFLSGAFENFSQGGFLWLPYISCTVFNKASSAAPSDSAVSMEAGLEPRAVAFALASRRLNH